MASVVLRVIEGSRRDRYWGALNHEAQHAVTELIAAGAITTCHDLLSPSERLQNAVDNRHLTELRW